MGQYNLMSFKENDSCWWKFLKLLHIEEMAVKFLYQTHVEVTDDIKYLILSKIKEMEAKDAQKLPFRTIDRVSHALSTHKLLDQMKWSIELDFDVGIIVWHVATELCYYLNDGPDSIKEKSLMSLHLSRPDKRFDLPKVAQDRPARGHNRRERKPDISEEPEIAEARKALLDQMKNSAKRSVPKDLAKRNELLDHMMKLAGRSMSKEDQFNDVLSNGCQLALELESVPRGWKWSVISEVWVEMLMHASNKCKARDHAHQMQRGGELITHVWLLMAHYGLTDHFQTPRGPAATAEIIVKSW
ncbi:hypothetical protein NL676_006590 [Syzygium grande]|nr:hypothetical protein NL676_006590 [Syzygium grande]